MKILHVIYGLAEIIGGPPVALATLARAQAARGDDVTVLPARRTQGKQTLEAGASDGLRVMAGATDHHLLWRSRELKRALREAARGRDVVHIHGTWRYHVLAAADAARQERIPYIVRPAGNLGAATRGHKALRKRLYLQLIERPALNRAAAIHCCSLKELRELESLGLTARTFVVPQPIEETLAADVSDEALPALHPPLRPGDRVLLYVGRVGFIKRLDVLLEAFVRLAGEFPEWRLIIAGTHEEPKIAAGLAARAAEAGLSDRVALPGTVNLVQKSALLRRASLFAQPSRHENFGISVAEALRMGLPCVVSDGVAIADDIVAAGAGVACPSEIESFTAALRRMLSDDDLRAQCAAAAPELARRFRPDAVAAQLALEYETCMRGMN